MSGTGVIPFDAPLDAYAREAEALLDALRAGEDGARWRFKWQHPSYRNRTVGDVDAAALDLADARTVVAHDHGFEMWDAVVAFTEALRSDEAVARFEAAVEAVVSGDLPGLHARLREHPELARARSTRRHHATLLHYVAANGVEDDRQRTPANAVEIATALLDAGAEPDALADMYDNRCTTMSMLVSSSHPAKAGVQVALAELLLDRGAALDGPGTEWRSAVLTALIFGFTDTAEALVRRGAPVDRLAVATGLGRQEDVRRLLPAADAAERHRALALAAQLGRVEAVRLLLDVGEDPDRRNPDGFHSHATPLHQAVWGDHLPVVRLLVERGARLDITDAIYIATPLGWALYGDRTAIAEFLRTRGAPRA